MTTEKQLAQARELSHMLREAADHAKDVFSQIAADLGIPVQVARAVSMLEKSTPMSELANVFSCDKSYITALADQMECLGLIERVPGEDRRIKLLELTTRGKAIRSQLSDRVAKQSPVMLALSESERVEFEKMLVRILEK
jgi:DNA-binding MarR family transcriptional regulator